MLYETAVPVSHARPDANKLFGTAPGSRTKCIRPCLRFTEPTSSALLRSETAELDQTGLVRMKRQRKPPQPFSHRVQEAPGIALILATDDKIVGIPNDDHVAR